MRRHREISRDAITPEHQRRGYARTMVGMLAEELKRQGVATVHLLAVKSNPLAVKTYRSLGFDCLGECHRYGSDYYIFELPLSV